jgi:hygromycin-B 4-O-kinase
VREGVSESQAQLFVSQHYGDRASRIAPVGAGEWSRAFGFSLDGNDVVIRFGAYGEDFLKDRLMGRHSSPDLPVPAVLEIGDLDSGFYAVSERRYGTFLEELTEAGFRSALPSVFAAFDAMRVISVTGPTGYGLWAAGSGGPQVTWAAALLDVGSERPRIAGWTAALNESPHDAEVFRRGFERLAELAETLPNVRHIVHGDLLSKNVLVANGSITAVIDWGNSLYGDYLYDAALISYWSAWYTAWGGIGFEEELRHHWMNQGMLPDDFDRRLHSYKLHVGLEHIAYNALLRRQEDLYFNTRQVRLLLDTPF